MSSYVVSARKYRPKTFSEVVGQGHITSTLETALRTDHLAHAFLFCGPRGVGKTTCARILARTINCENIQNGVDPCGECKSCKSFEQNASFNIIELDAASNNSVEHIRALNEQVRFRPQQGKYKVYIIDEVHMLSSAAFNAFLKTLEEPPEYAIFILATTEKQKIIPTILSRCQIFDFKRIMVGDMVAHLEKICESEGLTAEKDALTIIAQKSDGALRDALSLFDRLASVSEGNITYQQVIANLNILDYEVFFKTVDACAREDVSDVLLIFDKVLKDGFEGDAYLNGLATHFRDLLVCRDPRTLDLLDHSDQLKERYLNQARAMSLSFIYSALNLINQADITYPQVSNKRLHVEMALTKVCLINKALEASPVAAEKKTADLTSPSKEPTPQQPKPSSETKEPAQEQSNTKPQEKSIPTEGSKEETPAKTEETAATNESTATKRKPPTFKRPGKRSSSMPAIPKLDSLDDLKEKVVESEKEARANRLELNQENVDNWWNNYKSNLTSQSVQSTFNSTEITLADKTITLKVGSPMAKTRILQETGLLASIRKDFLEPQLTIEFEVEENPELEEKPKKLMTNKEKYELLVNKNPDMKELRSKLDLIVDHDE